MGKLNKMADRRQAGFTLVELAIVMIIIGLLIGGVLKGQALIANAQITATASAVKGYDAATTTFHDTYAAMPGDMTSSVNRLPNCAGVCVTGTGGTLGNGVVDGDFTNPPSTEMNAFWAQLAAADLVAGVDINQLAVWGGYYPSAPIGGGFTAAYFPGASGGTGLGANVGARRGHYLDLNNVPGAAGGQNALTALQAARLDRKIDDGAPTTGTVFPDDSTASPCIITTGGNSIYDEQNSSTLCDLFIRFQN